jgi:GT2 family glycosyltransferase
MSEGDEHIAPGRTDVVLTEQPRPLVDVGVVTYNTRDLTVAALRRLVDGSDGCRLRLLVRDNASGDGTVDAVAAHFPEAEVDAGSENLGFAAGVNTLLARSTAPWFLALNSDAWPDPGAVLRLVRAAEAFPFAAAVAPRLERPDGTLEHSTYPFPSVEVAAVTGAGLYRRIGRGRAERLALVGSWMHDRPRPVDWAVGAALLIRREALEDIGGFDERFFMYVEDLEWAWRARRHGWEIRFEPAAVVRHVGNASGAAAYGRRRTATYLHNTYRFYRRHHGPVSTAAFRALNLVGCVRLYVQHRLRHDRAEAAFWADHVRAHVTLAAPSDRPRST